MIGPRLTRSKAQRNASTWAAEKFREYGLTNVHQENWTIKHPWELGTADAQIITPVRRKIAIASAGWSPGTNGSMQGRLVYASARTSAELLQYRGRLSGAVVIMDPPFAVGSPSSAPSPTVPFPLKHPYQPEPKAKTDVEPFYDVRSRFLKAEGVLAILRDSANPYNLLRMGNASDRNYGPGPIPTAFITHEDYGLLSRLLTRGPVEQVLSLTNRFSGKDAQTSNTVAELKGVDKPDEVVILGAHLDSWNLASGSTDDGTIPPSTPRYWREPNDGTDASVSDFRFCGTLVGA